MADTQERGASPCAEYQSTAWAVRAEVLPAIAERIAAGTAGQAPPPEASAADVPVTGGVAVLSLRGLLTPRPSIISLLLGGGGGLRTFRSCLREAVASEEIGSILLDIDSPGGSTDLIAEVAEEIRGYRGTKPIIALANTQAASGAYWIASAADEVVVTPSGMVGSIGIYLVHIDESGWEEQHGFKTTYISAGKFKVEGNSSEPLSDEARSHRQEIVDDFYNLFTEGVAKGRGVTAAAVKAGFGEGRVVTAKRAVELGMADRVDSFESTVSKLAGTEAGATRKTSTLRISLIGDAPQAHRTSEHEEQPEDKPAPKGETPEEERARIARLATARPFHTP